MLKTVVVLGATSAIATAVLRQLVGAHAYRVILLGRHSETLTVLKQDLLIRGAKAAEIIVADMGDSRCAGTIVQQVMAKVTAIDILLIAYGELGHEDARKNASETERLLQVNFTSTAALLSGFLPVFETQRHGHIVVISSVAGDRGRQSNYIYGAAKGGLSVFLEGLRHYCFRFGVHVLTVKPGFIATPMTAHFPKGALWSTPEAIAPLITTAIFSNQSEIYVPGFWRWVMWVIRLLPEWLFYRSRL
jgi:decaprenylphospho-beta-D-erythro-pentofuranosid-2-ulose 2-reductase